MHDAAGAPQRQIDATVGVVLRGFRKDKAAVLQQQILQRLETFPDGRPANLAQWYGDVRLCGAELSKQARGTLRSKDFGVYPERTFNTFMGELKKAMKTVILQKDQDLGLRGLSPAQRDEAHGKFHVGYIGQHSFGHPSAAAGERERLLTFLYWLMYFFQKNNPGS